MGEKKCSGRRSVVKEKKCNGGEGVQWWRRTVVGEKKCGGGGEV